MGILTSGGEITKWSQRWGSNPQPAVYKTAALPLSYFGEAIAETKSGVPTATLANQVQLILARKFLLKKAPFNTIYNNPIVAVELGKPFFLSNKERWK